MFLGGNFLWAENATYCYFLDGEDLGNKTMQELAGWGDKPSSLKISHLVESMFYSLVGKWQVCHVV